MKNMYTNQNNCILLLHLYTDTESLHLRKNRYHSSLRQSHTLSNCFIFILACFNVEISPQKINPSTQPRCISELCER